MKQLKAITVDEALAEVERIRSIGIRDDEAAHSLEDDLHARVLHTIADEDAAVDMPTAIKLAAAALSTRDIEFARWCA